MSRTIGAIAVCLVLCGVLWAQTGRADVESASPVQSIADLHAALDSIISAEPIPGAAIAVVSRDSIEWIGTFGSANLETGAPVTENTHFGLGSCTKSFVGLGFLKLVGQGKINLDTPVSDIAPEIVIENPWEDTHPVRVAHLLEHSAGFDDAHLNWFYFDSVPMPLDRALEIKAHLRRVRWPPGTRFSYSSPGYTLAGYVLGKVVGKPYEDYLKEAILDPIGMHTSTVGLSHANRDLLSLGYGRNKRPFPPWQDYDEPAGAINSSIKEMALFVQFLLNRGRIGGNEIISADAFDRIGRPTTTLAAQAGVKSGYSFGIGTRFRSGHKWYGHAGAIPGFYADYEYSPEHGVGYVALINTFDNVYYDEIFTLLRDYMDFRAGPPVDVPPASVPSERLREYCGYYESRSPRMRLAECFEILAGGTTVSYEQDTLYTRDYMSDRRPLVPVSESLFRRSTDPEATFTFFKTSDGTMALATAGSYFERTGSWKPLVYGILFYGALVVMGFSLVYALFWVPVHIYKRWRGVESRSRYLRMRVVPLCAILCLVLGGFAIAGQNILQLGQMTVRNIVFSVSTVAFAVLSICSVFTTYRSFSKPVRTIARINAAIVSAACLGMTLYLGYWGIIGLQTWSY